MSRRNKHGKAHQEIEELRQQVRENGRKLHKQSRELLELASPYRTSVEISQRGVSTSYRDGIHSRFQDYWEKHPELYGKSSTCPALFR
jgi:hypothetical protein